MKSTGDRWRPEETRPSRPGSDINADSDEDLIGQLKDYLACRLRSMDPPPPFAEAWDRFYATNTPRIRAFLKRGGLPAADREDCLQEVWREVVVCLRDLTPSRLSKTEECLVFRFSLQPEH
jgi:hypothetical protein